jgi:glycosyltransferase involved in cell wall biosynthesis/nucleoside-diphosphate-sugar epimerase
MVIATKSLSRNEILDQIWDTVPVGSPEPTEPKTLAKLRELTENLIKASDRERLKTHPFQEVLDRGISFDRDRVASTLQDRVIAITGGAGFVGGHLIAHLKQLGVKRIISLDLANAENICCHDQSTLENIPCIHYHADVRDYGILREIFAIEQPDIVFHLAAQRLPGLAETQIYQTVSTNILGSDNIIRLCEEFKVEACIFSSTGKASRYYTPDIYAGSKKIAEWLFSDRLDEKQCLYGIVRFTHVVENSPISFELDKRVEQGLVSLHAPDRFTYAQNVTEAVHLLLNSLPILERGKAKILAVTNLGWPVNTLDIALHKILCAGGNIPIYFKGVPKGYETSMFMGQLDLSGEREIIPMLNVLEVQDSQLSPTKDMVIAELHPYSSIVLDHCVANIKQSMVCPDLAIRSALSEGVKAMAISSFRLANPVKLLDILGWGIDPEQLAQPGVDRAYYHEFAELLLAGLDRRLESIDRDRVSAQALTAVSYLQTVPSTSSLANCIQTNLMLFTSISARPKVSGANPNYSKPRILYISTKSEIGGVTSHLIEFMTNFRDTYDIHLISGEKELLTDTAVKLGINYHIVPTLKNKATVLEDLKTIWECVRLINKIQPDLVHMHSSKAGLVGRIAAQIANVPSIFTAHGWGFTPGIPRSRQLLLWGLEFGLAKLSRRIICVSKFDRDLALNSGVGHHHQLHAIYNGIADSELIATPATVAADRAISIVMIARFAEQKDHTLAIQACQYLPPQVKMVFVGDGHLLPRAKKLAADLGVTDRIEFLGNRLNVPEILANSQVCLLLSHYEGLPISILEGMRAGLPVVASNVGGVSEQVIDGQNGILVPREDLDATVTALMKLVNEPKLRQSMGMESRKLFLNNFHIDRTISQTQQVYDSLLTPSPKIEPTIHRGILQAQ